MQRMCEVSVSLEAAWISCDHTFRSIANIGLVRDSDKHWIKQYNGLFCTLNDVGRSNDLETYKIFVHRAYKRNSLLHDRLKNQGKTVAEFYVDNCCSWRYSLQGIFGMQLSVYFDVFHAVQRITKVIPKRHPYHKHCLSDLICLWCLGTLLIEDP